METDYLGLEHPIWLGEAEYVKGRYPDLDKKIAIRRTRLLKLQAQWAGAARQAVAHPLETEHCSWRQLEDFGFFARPFQYAVKNLLRLEGIQDTWTISNMHRSHVHWYGEKLGYRLDCTLLLVQLLNSMRFARENENPYLIPDGPGFPLMNYVMEIGPTYPLPDTVFGRRDRQVVVHDGGTLWYFEGDDYTRARHLIVDKVIV